MRNTVIHITLLLALTLSMILCGCKNTAAPAASMPEEDKNAKQMLQGIWLSVDDGSVVMQVKGDSIYYADISLPAVSFAVYGDTLVTKNITETRYPIVKQTSNVFQFISITGDAINLVKSNNPDDALAFERPDSVVTVPEINQGKTIKRDSVFHHNGKQLHAYVQVNPSTYKVITTSVNESGLKVDNIYYDNIINIALFQSGNRVYSKDITKKDFIKLVPSSFITHAILSDISIDSVSDDGVHFIASILQPDSETSYVVKMTVSLEGKMVMELCN